MKRISPTSALSAFTTALPFAQISVVLGVTSLLCLAALHWLSPEIDPSWRMISEYAYGKYQWILTLLFYSWGLCTISAAIALLPEFSSFLGQGCVLLLLISGLGAILGGFYDIRDDLHGLGFALGVPFLPPAAMIISLKLKYSNRLSQVRSNFLLFLANATWISLVVMGLLLVKFVNDLKSLGEFHPDRKPPFTSLPEGISTVVGYPNRILVASYILWEIAASLSVMNLRRIKSA